MRLHDKHFLYVHQIENHHDFFPTLKLIFQVAPQFLLFNFGLIRLTLAIDNNSVATKSQRSELPRLRTFRQEAK